MRITAITPMLRTWDLPATIEFYAKTLGFACERHDEESGWAALNRDGCSILLSGPNEHEGDRAPAFTGSLYFRVTDVAALWAQIKERVRVCYPLEDFPYGMREFGVYDNNGYLLQFGQEVGR